MNKRAVSLTSEPGIVTTRDLLPVLDEILESLRTSDHIKVRRPDLGLKIQGYRMYRHIIRIDIIRLDREDFFALA